MTRISVIVPIFRVEEYVAHLVRALAAQTFRDFDVILVDDASDDRSVAIAKQELLEHGLDHVLVNHTTNQGLSAARNSGIRAAKSRYHVCVDSDDVLHHQFLETLWRGVERFGATISMCGFASIGVGEEPRAERPEIERLTRREALRSFLLRKRQFIAPAMLIETAFAKKHDLFYSQEIRFAEDAHFIWRTLLCAPPPTLAYSDAPLYGYVIRPGSIMRASSTARIRSGYAGLEALSRTFDETVPSDVRRWMLSRWTLGALRSSSKMLSEHDFVSLAADWDSRRHAMKLVGFPDPRVRLLAATLLVSPRLFYRTVGRLR